MPHRRGKGRRRGELEPGRDSAQPAVHGDGPPIGSHRWLRPAPGSSCPTHQLWADSLSLKLERRYLPGP